MWLWEISLNSQRISLLLYKKCIMTHFDAFHQLEVCEMTLNKLIVEIVFFK